jgi:predicted RNA-binding protein with PIN domain
MHAEWLIIDGNNLVHHDSGWLGARRDFGAARLKLVSMVDALAGRLANRMTIVFDGTIGGKGEASNAPGVEVIFSPADKTADTVIEQMVEGSGIAKAILVVTSDRMERDVVEGSGAETMSCAQFRELLEESHEEMSDKLRRDTKRTGGPTMGDFFN